MKHQKTADLVAFAVHELDESRSMRAGLHELSIDGDLEQQALSRRLLVEADAEAETRSAWLHDQTARARAGPKKLLKGWHDAAALAAVAARTLRRDRAPRCDSSCRCGPERARPTIP